ncbi:uncharacterized protein [Parasteatoda tepidariorum]|uniref:uncharacterized protein n=1 Tax=Parasteatoda tepidariorum TaxID=114398 RepID=UPI001C724536|nr:uncharacterized protein LOC107450988 [Parasteatoda tepidariorum]
MCVCGEDACWILCCGKYKFLLRSAWIVLFITTLIDISAILAYWYLAPKALDSKPGLKLALILLVAVLLLYFFSTLLSGFIIMKLSPNKRELSEFPTSNRTRTGNRLTSFGLHPMPYSDGFRRVLPNNAPAAPSYRNAPRIDSTNQQNRHINVRENARSNIDFRNYSNPSENLNLNDAFVNRHNAQSCDELSEVLVVPKVVITRPENSAPTYENIEADVCESSKSLNNLGSSTSTTVTPQNGTPNLPRNLEAQTCDLSSKSQSNLCSCSNIAFRNKPKNLPQKTFYRSGVSRTSSAVEKPYLKTRVNQSNVYSSNTNLANRRLFSRSESYVNRPVTNADEKTLEMSINQNTTSRRVDRNPTIRSDFSSGSETTGSEISEQYKNQSFTITRKTNSFLAKSQPVDNQYRRYVVDKLPITSNPQTQMLFKAIMKSEELFEQTNNAPKTNYVVKTVPVQV